MWSTALHSLFPADLGLGLGLRATAWARLTALKRDLSPALHMGGYESF
jgi:hypothetical protein